MLKGLVNYGLAKLRNQKGQGMVEYGLIIALVAVIAIGGLILLGPEIAELFKTITDKLKPSA